MFVLNIDTEPESRESSSRLVKDHHPKPYLGPERLGRATNCKDRQHGRDNPQGCEGQGGHRKLSCEALVDEADDEGGKGDHSEAQRHAQVIQQVVLDLPHLGKQRLKHWILTTLRFS